MITNNIHANNMQVSPISEAEDIRNSVLNAELMNINRSRNWGKFKENTNNFFLEGFLYNILSKSIPYSGTSEMLESSDAYNRALVHDYVSRTGFYNIINNFTSANTLLLSEAVNYINKFVTKTINESSIDNEETYTIDPSDRDEFYKGLDGESIDGVCDIIKNRVSQATEEFVEKNILDDINIKDTLQDTKEKLDNIRTGDDTIDEEIKNEYTILCKKKINSITNNRRSIFEQIVVNISNAILTNEMLKEEFTNEDGHLDMDTIIERSTATYTFLEMLNTLNMEDVNKEYIEKAIKIE